MKLKILVLIPIITVIMLLIAFDCLDGFTSNSMQAVPVLAQGGTGGQPGSTQQDATGGQPGSEQPGSTGPDTAGAQPGSTVQGTAVGQGQPEQSDSLTFMAVGDIMLGRSVGKRLATASGGFGYAFSGVQDILKGGDVVFANIEDPITASTHGLDSKRKIVLKASPDAMEAIKSGGFNLVSIANNHMLDYYDTGLFDTISLLRENGIAYAGGGKDLDEARKPAVIEKCGLRIGLLSYTDMAQYIYAGNPSISFAAGPGKAGLAPRDYAMIREDIAKLRGSVDILAVSLHWGVEESFTVTPEQVDFARKLIDDGADVILGHHPHQFQGIELYKGKPIIYSMGNFMFDQNDPENMESFIVGMEYSGTRLKSMSAIPVRILDKCHVEVQKGADAAGILSRETSLCGKLGTSAKIEDDKLVFDMEGVQ